MLVIEKICRDNEVEVPAGMVTCSDERSSEYWEIWAAPYTSGSIQVCGIAIIGSSLYVLSKQT